MASVVYSVFRRVRLSATSALWFGLPGDSLFSNCTCGKWHTGAVMPVRAGYNPVRMLERVGEQSGLAAWYWVRRTERFARRARFGVRW